ncbi:MAG TPA: adenylate/guanylate cyclase domain-containing protein, partial [Candidatus Baltobacteraceae bacterium]|nr:adenylate/guanylate cyclase domain-containing protein [Candidatus Baltobacteraceae bacterium]
MKPAPSGTVAFLFTDIEGSTVRWEAYPDAMKSALRRHDALLREAIERRGGRVFKTIGDAFCAAFGTVRDAADAAFDAQRALAASEWSEVDGVRVRMAIHAGTADERDGDYFGQAVNRVARLLAIGNGGQVLLSQSAAQLAQDSLPEGTSLRDLGQHRLKDLSVPEHVYQLVAADLADDFAALRSLDAVQHNLPSQLTSFVGRSADLDEIERALETSRLLTLAGPGGVGKTRLALQAGAHLVARFADGVWFVELAEIVDPALVAHEFATVLRVPALPGKSVAEAVAGALNHKTALLIVDNCEHVIGAAAAIIDSILRRAPDVRVLATSRQPLDIPGEFVHRVVSLALPPPSAALRAEDARAYDAVQLFEERSHAATGTFVLTDEVAPTIAEICRSLDGIPLAIELAAPKLGLLSPTQLAGRLTERMRLLSGGNRTALHRQQTLRALIDWSHDLLDERERTLFRLLAAFSGGWTIEAAERVCGGAGIDEAEVLELLGSLVAKSLVVADTSGESPRYRFLESIREYAREQLASKGDEIALGRRHASYHAGYVREHQHLSTALDDRNWQAKILSELDNIRLALDWSLARRNDARLGLEILAPLRRPRLIFLPQEASHWFALGAAAIDAAADERLAAAVLAWHASANLYGEASAGERIAVAQEAVRAARRSDDPLLVASAFGTLGICLRDAGRLDDANAAFNEAEQSLAS